MLSSRPTESSRPTGLRRTSAVFLSLGIAICLSVQPGSSSSQPTSKPHLQEARLDRLSAFILSLDIASGCDLAAAALADRRIRVWKLSSGEVQHEFSFPAPEIDEHLRVAGEVEPISVRFSPDGKYLAISFLSRIYLYDVVTWTEKMSLGVPGEDQHRADLKITPETPQLERRTTEQAQADKNKPVLGLNESMRAWAHAKMRGDGRTRMTDFAFTKDGSSIIAAYGKMIGDFSKKDTVRDFDISSDGRWLASTTWSGLRFQIWDLSSKKPIMMVTPKEWRWRGPLMNRIRFSPDGRWLVVGNNQVGDLAIYQFGPS
jgi:WD40 repeat protein